MIRYSDFRSSCLIYLVGVLLITVVLALPANLFALIDYPHTDVNGIGCNSCHFVYGTQPSLLPEWTAHEPQNIDDAAYNTLCWSCHDDVEAPYMRTHSSLQIDDDYGNWTVECRVCHNPHYQKQSRVYGAESYLYSGTSTSISTGSITKGGAGWITNEYQGYVVYPNVIQKNYNYKILGNSEDTLIVQGPVNLSKATVGNTFAIVYGNLINDKIDLSRITIGPSKSGIKEVKFFRKSGDYSFADGDEVFNGVCEVCHTQTTHFQNSGGATDQHHSNVGGADGLDCMQCHDHGRGFAHGGGSGGAGCEECHGHDPGYGGYTGGKGTFKSHSTHTENDADDLRGPNVGCDACHDTANFPKFADGQDLANTTVCDGCHSDGGEYDGVNDPDIGAKYGNGGELKYNWSNRVYDDTDNETLKAGNEKWCVTCHDKSPSQISGVNAPNIAGDENGSYSYGTGWGFYKTGHGLPGAQYYPSSGTTMPGAGLKCSDCHDLKSSHIDGDSRTYSQPGTPESYQSGYRLISVGGETPMEIPRTNLCPSEPGYSEQVNVDNDSFRLCFSCHDSEPFNTEINNSTNFRNESSGVNAHYYHLSVYASCGPGPRWASDWSVSLDSRMSCVSCHNVHGSTQLSMVRDGKLVNSEPGLQVAYYNETVSYICGGPDHHDPTPDNVTLPDSTGTVWNANVGTLCSACHGSCGFNALYTRTPFAAIVPYISSVYGKSGSQYLSVLFSEGVYSNPGLTGDLTADDFAIVDTDNGRSLASSVHSSGDNYARLTMSSPLDSINDINTDTIAAATGFSIYNSGNISMDITPVLIEDDSAGPGITNQNPLNGGSGILTDSDITFTLSDSKAGVDWTTLTIQLSGDKGYSKTYIYSDGNIISKTGSYASYNITVDPDADFDNSETISVIVNASDLTGNSLVSPAWTFTTVSGGAPQTVTLHPSGLGSNPGGYWTVPAANQWADYMDSQDGDASYATSNTGSQGAELYINIDDPTGLGAVAIESITVHVYARYVSGWSPSPPAYPGIINIGYKTGSTTVWTGDTSVDGSGSYNLISSATYTTDSDGGPLDLADVNNLQVSVKRRTSGGYPLRLTEIYVEVSYIP